MNMTNLELMQAIDNLSEVIAQRPCSEWAGWTIYLIERLDGQYTGFGAREYHLAWLESTRKSILGRLRGEGW